MAFIQNQSDDGGENQNRLIGQQMPSQGQPAPTAQPEMPSQSPPSAPPVETSAAPQQSPAPQRGSGRFTNLQKYVQANEGAGQRLATGATKQIERKLAPVKKEAAVQEQRSGQSIQQGQQALTQGQALQQQMAAPEFTPQRAVEFAGTQGNVERVGQFRTGQAIDERALEQQRQAFLQATANLGQRVDERGQQVGSEIGRINLLKEAFGGRNRDQYTTGQSRLDNLLLQAGPGNLQALQQNIQANRQNINELQAKAAAQGKSIQQVIADEASLAKGIQETTAANVERFKTGLGGQVGEFNRALEENLRQGNQFVDFYNQAITDAEFKNKYGISKKDYQFNRDLFGEFGLQRGQQTFNVFNNRDLNLGQVAEIEGRRAQDWRDVATGQNVSEYEALARLKGLTQPEFELAKASDINRAGYRQYEDERSLQGRINKAREDFLKKAETELIKGTTGWVEGVKGTGAVNLADYLRNPDYYNRAQVQFQRDEGSTYGDNFSNLAQAALTLPLTLSPALIPGLFGGGGQDYGKGEQYVTGRTIGGGVYGDRTEQGFLGATTGQALRDYLASQGFANYLTEQGVRSSAAGAEDLARQFGYRTSQRDDMTQEGFYNPMFERERFMQSLGLPTGLPGEVSTQIVGRSGPMTAEEALANRPTQETPQQRATREQIASATTTSSAAERAALRQELIDANRYLTSNPEYQEILAREQSRIGSGLERDLSQQVMNRYLQDVQGTPEGRLASEQFGYFRNELPAQVASSYYRSGPGNLGIATQPISERAQQELQRSLEGQIYGTTIGELSPSGTPTINSQDILNRILGVGSSGKTYQQQFDEFQQAVNRLKSPTGGLSLGI